MDKEWTTQEGQVTYLINDETAGLPTGSGTAYSGYQPL